MNLGSIPNNSSLVNLVTIKNASFLLTGDIEPPAQPQICCNLLLRAKIWRFWDTYDLHFKTILLPNTKYHPIASAQLGLIAAS
jgi:hypothetical protein